MAQAKKVIRRRREKKNIERGQVHIRSSFNNTMVTVTDTQLRRPLKPPLVLLWSMA